MSYSTVVVFFIVLVGIYITHGQQCDDGTGICVKSLTTTVIKNCNSWQPNHPTCDNIKGNKGPRRPCCVDCQQEFINEECNRISLGSVGQYYTNPNDNRTHCCPDMYEVAKPYENSPCRCCQYCKPKARCRGRSFCVTASDPINNEDYCKEIGGRIKPWCRGEGCQCCHIPRK